jgi:hypothetical protein
VDVKNDVKPQSNTVNETQSLVPWGRERVPYMGDLLGDLILEGLDTAQMENLRGVTDEIVIRPNWNYGSKWSFRQWPGRWGFLLFLNDLSNRDALPNVLHKL